MFRVRQGTYSPAPQGAAGEASRASEESERATEGVDEPLCFIVFGEGGLTHTLHHSRTNLCLTLNVFMKAVFLCLGEHWKTRNQCHNWIQEEPVCRSASLGDEYTTTLSLNTQRCVTIQVECVYVGDV